MHTSSNSLALWMENTLDFVNKNKKLVLATIVGMAFVTAGFIGYSFYQSHVNKKAYEALLNALKYYDGSIGTATQSSKDRMVFASDTEKWQKTEQIFKEGGATYSNTRLAPIFLAYQSTALLNQGKLDEAITVLTKATDQMKNKAVRDEYRIKLALMMSDSDKETVKHKGFDLLKSIASDRQSTSIEAALYHLGAHYWHEKKYSEAKNYWLQLIAKYGAAANAQPSHYVKIVKEKLSLVSTKVL